MTQEGKTALSILYELGKIPAPSHHEDRRAGYCRDWLLRAGCNNAVIDDAKNVICSFGDISGDLFVYMAHSDVVFPDETELPMEIRDGKIFCPGIGDDTANAACLMTVAKTLAEKNYPCKNCGVLIVIDSCEEGLGNLKGCRKIMADYPAQIKEVVSFDLCVPEIANKPVGSRRYRITVQTVGGHSYSNFGNDNAIAVLSSLIHSLYQIQPPQIGKSTYNVGLISGGTSVNTIAQSASCLFEIRSDEREGLLALQREMEAVLSDFRSRGYTVSVELLGDRPCQGEVDEKKQQALETRARSAVEKITGETTIAKSASTDCNIPSSMGIPSICMGTVRTAGAHTREEFLEIHSLDQGIAIMKEMIFQHFDTE